MARQPVPSFLLSRGGFASVDVNAPPLRIDARDLLGERRELLIVHRGREYRLRLTSNGKLILTA